MTNKDPYKEFKKFLLTENQDSPTHMLLTDVYYIEDFEQWNNEAVPAYEIIDSGYDIEDMMEEDENIYLYMNKGDHGWYNEDEEEFTSEGGSNTRMSPDYVESSTGN